MIGLCTDSNALLPPALIERFGVEVVPLTITVDGIDHMEGVDLDVDEFYALYEGGHRPVVRASQPRPGQFAAAYDDLVARGCTQILSVHVCSQASSTVNAARLAAHHSPVPVRVVDTGTAGFGVSCCVWQAAEALAGGALIEEAALVAERLAPSIGNVFVMESLTDPSAALQVNRWRPGSIDVMGEAPDLLSAVNMMADAAIAWGDHLRVGVGHSGAATEPLADALEAAVSESANVLEVVRFRISPSVGAFGGPGAAGCFMFPTR